MEFKAAALLPCKVANSFIIFDALPPPRRVILCRANITPVAVNIAAASQPQQLKLAEFLQAEALRILEWPSVCKQLSAFTSTPMGLDAANTANIPFGQNPFESRRLLAQTSAAMTLSGPLDFSGVEDVSEVVRSAVAGEMLSIGELCSVGRTLRSARSLLGQLEEISSRFDSPNRLSPLLEILRNCDFLIELEQKIGFCINCDFSVILDQASEELEIIRSEKKRNMENLGSIMRRIATQIFQSGGNDRPLVTTRRSRMCVAIKTKHRHLLPKGVVLDSSSSGATYFMEPREAVELNNLEVRLSNAEKMEEQAILSLLSAEIAQSSREIKFLLDRVLELDLVFARASHAGWMNGVCPNFSSDSCEDSKHYPLSVDLQGLHHPLLLESSLRKSPSSGQDTFAENSDIISGASSFPVPIDIKIKPGRKVVVISGPNTGGKTASMKTLGLASIMSKAGMYLPARNNPLLPWFDLVLADIGDHQSVEQSLSTFSGHISWICKILEVASEKTLVLLDEIGSGTDPSEGVALSASILQYLKDRVNLAVVTTHYADLTRLKEKDARFENAAMEFSLESLQPTYRILWGSMGESNALSIAKKIGFDEKVILGAQSWIKKLRPEKMQKRNSLLFQSLTEERNTLEIQAERALSLHSDTMKLYNEILEEADDLDQREAALKAKESKQIQNELNNVKAKIDNVIQQFENDLTSTTPDKSNSLLKKSESAIASIIQAYQISENFSADRTSFYIPEIGEQVHVKGLGIKLATVVEAPANDDTVLVQYGKIRVRVNLGSITAFKDVDGAVASKPSSKRQGQQKRRLRSLSLLSENSKDGEISYAPVVQTSKNTLDLRGMRAEEAKLNVDMAINSTRVNSVLFIIHGMGTGVLKELVLELLQNHPRVAKFEQESPMNYGCTVAYIK
ncbi:hypothetical protein F511_03033 [Dorcoceras hygrometricum]|nr:hypothetical protein F511_03033 [Dorcoceras hygrometricum]